MDSLPLPPDPDPARAALDAGDAAEALTLLRGREDRDAAWLRAVAAATLGDAVRVHLAVRDLDRLDAWPADPTPDVAPELALAVCDDDAALPAWRVLGGAVAARLELSDVTTDLTLAWELAVRHADATPPAAVATHAARARAVIVLAALRRRMGHHEAAQDLARGAQEAALTCGDAEAFTVASLVLADVVSDAGDAELGVAVRAHARRRLADLFPPDTCKKFYDRLDDTSFSSED